MSYYLAIDIGASSGRHIVGWKEENGIKTKEIYRFKTGVTRQDGHLVWDLEAILAQIKTGIAMAREAYGKIRSLSIDTWGVDYVLMKGDKPVLPCYSYRDSRTEAVIPLVHQLIPFTDLYRRTGIQFQPFNTIYQLYADKLAGRLEGVTDFLMLPEYLMYRLAGVKVKEFTDATTTGMVNAETGEFDPEIIRALDLPPHLFPKLKRPGAVVGRCDGIKVVLCATHDTGSAVEGIPMKGNHPYISSGTWSLLGIKSERPMIDLNTQRNNWSNEGGVGYTRFQKNIMGMWLVDGLRRELCPAKAFAWIDGEAERSRFDETVNVNDPAFFAPRSMREAFDAALTEKPQDIGDYFRCAYRSLALCYKNALEELELHSGCRYGELYIVGGGAKNELLNRYIQEITGKKVIALPIEATSLGNLKVQMEADL